MATNTGAPVAAVGPALLLGIRHVVACVMSTVRRERPSAIASTRANATLSVSGQRAKEGRIQGHTCSVSGRLPHALQHTLNTSF